MSATGAYYNEIDPFAAAWLRELINAGHIAPGEVDERDIRDVRPDDLAGFRQCHFFAGIGVWSLALRNEGIPDDFPIWTASCPCPPFSSAGPNFRCPLCDTKSPVPNAVRTGAFDCVRCGHEWQADSRHLFPELFRLIRECSPELVIGEQVASADGRTWLDVVSASLEMLGYAVGSPDTCAAGFGAPHIRQRLYWVADADNAGLEGWAGMSERSDQRPVGPCGLAGQLADTQGGGQPEFRYALVTGCGGYADGGFVAGGLANSMRDGAGDASGQGLGAQAEADHSDRSVPGQRLRSGVESTSCGMADANGEYDDRAGYRAGDDCGEQPCAPGIRPVKIHRPGPTNGLWRDVDWLGCTDGKWRPVEPGTFPLVDGGAIRNRVGGLRGAGNAINVAQAQGFIEAVIAHLSPLSPRARHSAELECQ